MNYRTVSLLMAVPLALAMATGSAFAAGNADAGKAKASSCAGCHGAKGEGKGKFPHIAGLDEKKFVQDLEDYKAGKRPDAMMKGIASKLSEEDMQNLAAYYASLK